MMNHSNGNRCVYLLCASLITMNLFIPAIKNRNWLMLLLSIGIFIMVTLMLELGHRQLQSLKTKHDAAFMRMALIGISTIAGMVIIITLAVTF